GDVRLLRMAAGPGRHEPADFGRTGPRGAANGVGGRVPRGRDPPSSPRARHRDLVPAPCPVREDAEREPGQRRPHAPLRERAVRGRAGDRVSPMDARLRTFLVRSGFLFLISLVLVAGFWYHREFYQIGFTNLLVIGGFVTFLVIWAALRALLGELRRGDPRGDRGGCMAARLHRDPGPSSLAPSHVRRVHPCVPRTRCGLRRDERAGPGGPSR